MKNISYSSIIGIYFLNLKRQIESLRKIWLGISYSGFRQKIQQTSYLDWFHQHNEKAQWLAFAMPRYIALWSHYAHHLTVSIMQDYPGQLSYILLFSKNLSIILKTRFYNNEDKLENCEIAKLEIWSVNKFTWCVNCLSLSPSRNLAVTMMPYFRISSCKITLK